MSNRNTVKWQKYVSLILFVIVCILFLWLNNKVNKLESKALKDKIETVEKQTNKNYDDLRSKLDKINNNFITVVDDQTKKDSTLSQTIAKISNDLVDVKSKLYALEQQQATENSSTLPHFWQWYEYLFLVGFVISVLLLWLLWRFIRQLPEPEKSTEKEKRGINKIVAKLREFIIKVLLDSKRLKSHFTSLSDNNNEKGNKKKEDKTQKEKSEEENKDNGKKENSEDKQSDDDNTNRNVIQNKIIEENKTENTIVPPPIQYLMGFARDINGFNKVVETQQEDTFFKIFDIKGDTAKFDLCVDVQRAKENNIFEYTAICVEVEQGEGGAGELKYNHDKDKWEVTQPAKIEFA